MQESNISSLTQNKIFKMEIWYELWIPIVKRTKSHPKKNELSSTHIIPWESFQWNQQSHSNISRNRKVKKEEQEIQDLLSWFAFLCNKVTFPIGLILKPKKLIFHFLANKLFRVESYSTKPIKIIIIKKKKTASIKATRLQHLSTQEPTLH